MTPGDVINAIDLRKGMLITYPPDEKAGMERLGIVVEDIEVMTDFTVTGTAGAYTVGKCTVRFGNGEEFSLESLSIASYALVRLPE